MQPLFLFGGLTFSNFFSNPLHPFAGRFFCLLIIVHIAEKGCTIPVLGGPILTQTDALKDYMQFSVSRFRFLGTVTQLCVSFSQKAHARLKQMWAVPCLESLLFQGILAAFPTARAHICLSGGFSGVDSAGPRQVWPASGSSAHEHPGTEESECGKTPISLPPWWDNSKAYLLDHSPAGRSSGDPLLEHLGLTSEINCLHVNPCLRAHFPGSPN